MRATSMPFQALAPASTPSHRPTRRARRPSRVSASGATWTSVAIARAPPAIAARCMRPIDLAVQPDRIVQQQRAAAADRGSDRAAGPCATRSPIAARPNTSDFDAEEPGIRARSTSSRRSSAQRSNRIVSCGNHSSAAPAATSTRLRTDAGVAARQRAIEPFRRLRRDRGARASRSLNDTGPADRRRRRRPRCSASTAESSPSFRARKPRLQAADLAQIRPAPSPRRVACKPTHSSPAARCRRRNVRQRGGVVHPLRRAPPAGRTARCRRGPSPRSSAPVPARNRNTVRPAGWPCRRASATARSPGRYP